MDPDPKSANKKKKKKKKKKGADVRQTAPGCYVASSANPPEWLVSCGTFRRRDFGLRGGDAVPDLSIDPETGVLSALNGSRDEERSMYVSVVSDAADARGVAFARQSFCDNEGQEGQCVTFVLTLAPATVMEVCRMGGTKLVSHVSSLRRHPNPHVEQLDPRAVLAFPLAGAGPYLCSQSHGGCLTHFTAATHHAVDLDCPVGTAVLAVGDGLVAEIRQHERCWGPWTPNLFHWNSLMLRLDSGLFVEYVHIRTDSACVSVGQRVAARQPICESGNVGFCPTPHLHIQCHESDATDAPTVKFAFRSNNDDGEYYVPRQGERYPT